MAVSDTLRSITPRIVKVGQPTTVHITAQWFANHHTPIPESIVISNVSGHAAQTRWEMARQVPLSSAAGGYNLTYLFPVEGEYLLLIDTSSGIETVSIYALDADLFHRRPFRGDTHIHSNQSDGKEEPAYVGAAARRIGLDFMALTDHWKYAPSLETIRAFTDAPIDLRIFPGEEVHIPQLPMTSENRIISSPVHIVNFGGNFSVNDWIRNNQTAFDAEVQAISKQIDDFPAHLDRRSYAECVWCFDKIREAGGLGIFCHPYWYTRYRYDVPEALTNLIFDRQPYDALELIGGYYRSESVSNHLQTARYHEERAKGHSIPIVGASDAHGCDTGELFGWYSTLVFSPSDTFADLRQSIMEYYSVAVESVPNWPHIAHGPFRLVKYAQFLLREILPIHDEICHREGLLMHAFLRGDAEAREKLKASQGSVSEFYDNIWGLR